MKIGFPYLKTNDEGEILLGSSFRTSSSFGIFDVEEKSLSIVDVQSIAIDSKSGLIDFFISRDVNTLISPECHPMAAKYFSDNAISIFQSISSDLIENLIPLLQKELSPFNAENVVASSSCGSSCKSCSSKCNS